MSVVDAEAARAAAEEAHRARLVRIMGVIREVQKRNDRTGAACFVGIGGR